MSRVLNVNLEIVDQLPVYDLDGFTKVAGLTPADFSTLVYLDGALQAGYPVTIDEIAGVGEYRVRFTPTSTGFWVVEVRNAINSEAFFGEYDVVKPTLLGIA